MTSQSREILTGSTKYQGTYRYICNNVVYTDTYELPSYPVRRVDIAANVTNMRVHCAYH